MAIYMKIDGISGHVSEKNHKDWIELHSIDFGANRGIQTKPGNVADREATKPNISEFIVTKAMCKATPLIFNEACVGKTKKVEIDLCQTGDGTDTYMKYTLENVMISDYKVAGKSAAGDTEVSTPLESIRLNFSKIEMKYTTYDSKHNAGSPVLAGYDLATGSKV